MQDKSTQLPSDINFYQTIVENNPSTIIITGGPQTDYQIIYVNASFERETGYTREEVIGKNPRFLHEGDSEQSALEDIRVALAKEKPCTVLLRNYRKNGEMFWNELRLVPIHDDNGLLTGYMGVQNDVTERVYAQQMAENVLTNAFEAITIVQDGRFVFVNPAVERLSGYPIDVFKSLTLDKIIHPDDYAQVQTFYRNHLAGKANQNRIIFRAVRQDGSQWWCETTATTIEFRGIAAIQTISLDVTQREETQQQLRMTSANLRAILDSAQQSFVLIDREARIIEFDQRSVANALDVFGETLYRGADIYKFVLEEEKEIFSQDYQRVLCGEIITSERTYRGRGRTYHFEVTFYPVTNEAGEILGACLSVENITERKLAEITLRESEELYRLMADNISDMMSTHDLQGVYTYVSPSCEQLLGYKPEELLGRTAYDLFHPDDLPTIETSHQTIVQRQDVDYSVEYRIRRQDGNYIWFETISSIVRDDITREPRNILAMSRDITGRKEAEIALQESEERFRQLAENIDSVFWLIDLSANTYLYISPAYDIIWQRSHLELMKKGPEAFATTLHPEDRDSIMEGIRNDAVNSINATYAIEHRIVRPSGEVRSIRSDLFPVRNEFGDVYRLAIISQDITEELRLKRQERALQLERDRSRLLSTFITKISHELRTPLSIIGTSAYFLEKLDDAEKRQAKSETIRKQIERITRLIDTMLLMVKLDTMNDMDRESVALRTVIGNVVTSFDKTIQAKKLAVDFVRHDEIETFTANATLLTSMFYHLLQNAIHHSHENGHIQIAIRDIGEFVQITVADNGNGIPAQHLPKIFDRFYRVDGAHSTEGLGLGLSIAKSIAELHGGTIHAESELDSGASFIVDLAKRNTD